MCILRQAAKENSGEGVDQVNARGKRGWKVACISSKVGKKRI